MFLSLDAAAKPQSGGFYFAYPEQPASRALAELVAEEFASIPGRPNRRADNNPAALAGYFGFARLPAGAPKVLVQHGFVTKPDERAWIAGHVDDLARAEYRALCRFLGWVPRPTVSKRVLVQARHQIPLEPGQSGGGPGSGPLEAALQERLLAWMRADGRFSPLVFPGDLPAQLEADLALVLSGGFGGQPRGGRLLLRPS